MITSKISGTSTNEAFQTSQEAPHFSAGRMSLMKEQAKRMKELISNISSGQSMKSIPIDVIYKAAEGIGMTKDIVKEALEKLCRTGDIFEPKRGFVSII